MNLSTPGSSDPRRDTQVCGCAEWHERTLCRPRGHTGPGMRPYAHAREGTRGCAENPYGLPCDHGPTIPRASVRVQPGTPTDDTRATPQLPHAPSHESPVPRHSYHTHETPGTRGATTTRPHPHPTHRPTALVRAARTTPQPHDTPPDHTHTRHTDRQHSRATHACHTTDARGATNTYRPTARDRTRPRPPALPRQHLPSAAAPPHAPPLNHNHTHAHARLTTRATRPRLRTTDTPTTAPATATRHRPRPHAPHYQPAVCALRVQYH